MPKKSSSKKPTQEKENADVQQAKPSSTPEKSGNEIDDIFSGKKRKKPEQIKADKANVNGEEKPKSMKKKKKKSKEDEERRFTDPPSKSRKKTEDGFSIYTEDELGFNNSSGGALNEWWFCLSSSRIVLSTIPAPVNQLKGIVRLLNVLG
ncbi:H/ACA ribonucleoprotein complex subunit 4-like [Populus nigra]|uniref:H/ACA ribonucleoprotein complex subunit 4-like n=1 Tax=Populus nigra TaxID=3691 RepID=UPI002B27ADFC|nr:H/ACA ribonucleoprotein complex subunit 4-like [Populus nigra]